MKWNFNTVLELFIKKQLWIIFIIFLPLSYAFYSFTKANLLAYTADEYITLFLVSCILYIPIRYRYCNQKRAGLRYFDKPVSTEYKRALNPLVPPEYITWNMRDGIYIGKYLLHHVIVPLFPNRIYHSAIIGGTGTGKTSGYIIPTIMSRHLSGNDTRIFAIDIKGELYQKTTSPHDKTVKVFSPRSREFAGYDPFYRVKLSKTRTEQDYALDIICNALINNTKENDFWVNSARTLLKGLLFYGIEMHMEFIDIVQDILENPIESMIDIVMSRQSSNAASRKLLTQFWQADKKLLSNITAQMNEKLAIFQNADVAYALRDNPNRITPLDLEDGYSIFCAIDENLLDFYKDLLRLIVAQVFHEMESRREHAPNTIMLIIDEFARLGHLDGVSQNLATLRSRNVSIMLCWQNLASIRMHYSNDEVLSILGNCRVKIFLDAEAPDDIHYISQMVGKYREKSISISEKGNGLLPGQTSTTTSYVEKDIITGNLLRTLPKLGQCLLLTPDGYFFIHMNRYYINRQLRSLSDSFIHEWEDCQ